MVWAGLPTSASGSLVWFDSAVAPARSEVGSPADTQIDSAWKLRFARPTLFIETN
jgi:hypothetical protein